MLQYIEYTKYVSGEEDSLFNRDYQSIEDENSKACFWRELKVNYDKIREELASKEHDIQEMLSKLSIENLQEICKILDINIKGKTEHKDIMKSIMQYENSIVLLYLQQLGKTRKVYIDEYYNYRYYNKTVNYLNSISLVKLLHMYTAQHIQLIELATLIEWKKRGTGAEFYIKGESNKDISKNILSEEGETDFCNFLQKNARNNNEYKLAMHCQSGEQKNIFLIYKKRNDVPYIDFDESKRVKNIEAVLFMVDMEEMTVHIKSNTRQEIESIKKYIQQNYGYELELSEKEIKEDYDITKFKFAFSSINILSQDGLSDFYISRITFSRSLLNKSPEIIIGEGKRDIWSAVVQANTMGLINIDSLYAIKSINIALRNIKKAIKVLRMEDGSVVFKLDDRGLSEAYVKTIGDKFQLMFDIPLNTKLRDKLDAGKANEIEAVLRTDMESKVDIRMKDVLEELVEDKMVKRTSFNKVKCGNNNCEWEKDYDNKDELVTECPYCGCDEFVYDSDNKLEVNDKQICKFVLETLKESFKLEKDSFIPFEDIRIGKDLMMYRFVYNKNEYRVLIAGKVLAKSVLKKIEKQLVPTMIIYYGIDKGQVDLLSLETIQFLQFGLLYNHKYNLIDQEKILHRAAKELENNITLHIMSAAKAANESINGILEKGQSVDEQEYKSDDFEDDVYAILKHMIVNGARWGATERGKPLPEGVVAFDYKQKQGSKEVDNKRAFIFDCKWNYDGKGYDVGINEKRKAIDYINGTNKSSQVELYCSDNQLSAHMLISNRFKSSQLDALNKHIKKHIDDGFVTVGIFVKIEGLIKFYDWFRKNYNNIQKYRDTFYKNLHKVLTISNEIIEEKHWRIIIDAMEECFEFIKEIDPSKIRNDIIK